MLPRAVVGALCAVGLIAGPASADDSGAFIGGAFQFVMVDGRFDEDGDSDCCSPLVDDSGYGFTLGGGYRINRNIAVDAAYWDLGDAVTKGFPGGGDRVGFDLSAFTMGGDLRRSPFQLSTFTPARA